MEDLIYDQKKKPSILDDITINPVQMRGFVKEIVDDQIKVHIAGRLGVISVKQDLIKEAGSIFQVDNLTFYFSFVKVVDEPLDYDLFPFEGEGEFTPVLVGGKLIEVNDTAVKLEITGNLGTIAVPRRWIFTDYPLKEGLLTQFYFSPLKKLEIKQAVA